MKLSLRLKKFLWIAPLLVVFSLNKADMLSQQLMQQLAPAIQALPENKTIDTTNLVFQPQPAAAQTAILLQFFGINDRSTKPLINPATWKYLSLFDQGHATQSIFSSLNKTITPMGFAALSEMLVTPQSVQALTMRQKAIKTLAKHTDLQNQLTQDLNNINNHLHAFFNYALASKNQTMQQLNQLFYSKQNGWKSTFGLNKFDTSPWYQGASQVGGKVLTGALVALPAVTAWKWGGALTDKIAENRNTAAGALAALVGNDFYRYALQERRREPLRLVAGYSDYQDLIQPTRTRLTEEEQAEVKKGLNKWEKNVNPELEKLRKNFRKNLPDIIAQRLPERQKQERERFAATGKKYSQDEQEGIENFLRTGVPQAVQKEAIEEFENELTKRFKEAGAKTQKDLEQEHLNNPLSADLAGLALGDTSKFNTLSTPDKIAAASLGIIAANDLVETTGDYVADRLSQIGSVVMTPVEREANNAQGLEIMQKQLIDMGHVARGLQSINALLQKYESLKKHFENNKHITGLFDSASKDISSNLRYLTGLLLTNTFTGSSSWFSWQGRIIAANKLMQDCIKDFIPVLRAVGELDVLLSCARLHNETKSSHHPFNFVKYSESKEPTYTIQKLWSPINPSMESIDHITMEKPATTLDGRIATGIALVLGSTLGIAPAHHATMTPFSDVTSIIRGQ